MIIFTGNPAQVFIEPLVQKKHFSIRVKEMKTASLSLSYEQISATNCNFNQQKINYEISEPSCCFNREYSFSILS